VAVTAFWYGNGMKNVQNGTIDLDTDTFKALLTTSLYTPDQDLHDFRDDVTNELAAAGGYSTGGVTLTTKTLTYDGASNEIRWDFDDPQWTSATFTARKLVIYKSRGGAASADELVMYVDFGADETVASGTFTYVVPATGAAKTTIA
jgi:hypothetical protein